MAQKTIPSRTRRVATKKTASRPRTTTSTSSLWHRIGRGALYTTAGLLPWFFLPLTVAPADTAKLLVAVIAGTVGLLALLADTIERRRLNYPGSWAALGVLAVVVTTTLSAVFSPNFALSVFGGLVLVDSLVHILVAAIVFVLAAVFLTDKKQYLALLHAFLGGIALACALSIVGFLGVAYFAALFPPSIAGIGFLAVVSLGIIGLLPYEKQDSDRQTMLLVATVLSVATLVFLNFKDLWIALALITLITAAFAFVRRVSITLPLVLSIVALAMILIGPRLPVLIPNVVEVRPNLTTSLAPMHALLSSNRAFVGTGPTTYARAFAESRPASFNASLFWQGHFDQGFSYLATVLVTTGVIGALAWLLLLFGGIYIGRQRLDDSVISISALVLAFTGIALLTYPGSFPEIITGALALGILVGATGNRRTLSFAGPGSWQLFSTFLGLVLIAAASLAGVYLVGQRYVAAAYFGNGSSMVRTGDIDHGIAQITRAVSLDPLSDEYQRGLSQAEFTKFKQLSQTSSSDPQAMQGTFTLMLQTATRATELNPGEIANWTNLAGIYESLTAVIPGADGRAIAMYSKAAELDPQSPAWPFARARVYASLARFQDSQNVSTSGAYAHAQDELAQALVLKPDFTEAKILSAQLYFADGDTTSALTRISELDVQGARDAVFAYQLGQLLYQHNQLPAAQAEFEHALSLSNNYADARYFLGLTYSRQGMQDQALAEFRLLTQQNPDNQDVRQIITNLENGRDALDATSTSEATSSNQ